MNSSAPWASCRSVLPASGPRKRPPPETVGALKRRFEAQGLLGLRPETLQVLPVGRRRRVPDEVVEALQRLTGRYDGFGYRELARSLLHPGARRVSPQSIKKLWQPLPPAAPRQLPRLDYHTYPTRAEARREVMTLSAQGWSNRSSSRFLHVSRPPITAWMTRFEADNTARLEDQSRAPHTTGRKAWLPVMVESDHLPKRHPDAGGFRIWSLRGQTALSVRTVERIMALNRRVYTDIPGTEALHAPPAVPQPHPFNATAAHAYWLIDGRMMAFAIEGHRWWSLIILDGYSRPRLAGAVARTEASGVALTVRYAAVWRYGVPVHLMSASGGAFIADVFAGGCTRLGMDHQPIVRTEGESSMHLMETQFNIQRRLYDYQCSLTQTPLACEEAQQHFLALYNTTAHQGLLKDQFASPMPLHVLGESQGRLVAPQERDQKLAHALFPRITNRYGCVTLHHDHFYVAQGLPQTRVLLWVSGEELRAIFDTIVVAQYHWHYDGRQGKVTDIRDGRFAPTRFASPQGALLPVNPQDCCVVYRPQAWSHRPA